MGVQINDAGNAFGRPFVTAGVAAGTFANFAFASKGKKLVTCHIHSRAVCISSASTSQKLQVKVRKFDLPSKCTHLHQSHDFLVYVT